MTGPIQVTREMRLAVYAEDCERLGHVVTLDHAVQFEGLVGRVAGPEDQLPHLTCMRCTKVWLVVEVPGDDYDAAEADLNTKLRPEYRVTRKERKERRERKAKAAPPEVHVHP